MTDSVQTGEGTWRKDWYGAELDQSLVRLWQIREGERVIAKHLTEANADRILADHERAAWAVEARDLLQRAINRLYMHEQSGFIGEVEISLARYPQQQQEGS